MSKRVNNKKGNRARKRDFQQKSKVRGGARAPVKKQLFLPDELVQSLTIPAFLR